MSKKSSTLRSKVKPRSLKKIMNLQDVSKRPSDSDDPIRDEVSDALRTRVADTLRESVMQAVQSQRAAVAPLDDLTACAAAISAYASVLFADSVFMVLLRDPDTEELILILPGLASNWAAGVSDKLSVLRFHSAHGLIPTILDRLGNCCSLRFFPLGCLLSCRDWILAESVEETSDDPTDGHCPAYQLVSGSGRRKRCSFTAQAPSSVGADAMAHLESYSDCRGEPCAELLIAEMLHVNGTAMVQRAAHSSPVSCLFPSVSNPGPRTIPSHAPLVCVPIKAGEQLEGFAMVAHVATQECPAGASSEGETAFTTKQTMTGLPRNNDGTTTPVDCY
ncbi:MAG: hypothetical protein KVP17_004143 [Porospora cf. gigantea B]|uniref:uncharacterized protein n=1 Tax=Porospora cf. gigantea B TaxID=2853592 RepID=UPI0035718482|nr:MAG: hypothetical protein KVP17_004143 [Porospora cf. gigantea B]